MPDTARRGPASAGVGAITDVRPTSVLQPPYTRLTLGIVATVFLVAFEAMAVATVMPTAVRAVDGLPAYAWAFSGFFAASLLAMVVAGERSDRVGPRGPLLGGVLTFVAGLLLAGSATSMPVFVLGRAVQGFGAGLVIVALYVVVGRAYVESLRPRAFAAMSAAWVLPSIVGPVVAGWVSGHLGWRWVFFGVAPLVVPAIVLIAPDLRTPALARPPATPTPAMRRGKVWPALATAVGAALLLAAGQDVSWWSLLPASLAVALLVPSLPRLLPRGALVASRGLPTVVALRGLLAGAFFGAEAFIPLALVTERGLSTTMAGLSLTGAALGWATGSWWQGRSGMSVSRPVLVLTGCGLVAIGILGAALAVIPSLPAWLAAVGWTIGGAGMGLALTSLGVLLFELSPPQDQGANSAALQVSDALGTVLCVGGAGVLLAASYAQGWDRSLTLIAIDVLMLGVVALAAAVSHRSAASPLRRGQPDGVRAPA